MGVPKLFNIIFEKFPKSHAPVRDQKIEYLFIDFNSIIYEAYEKVKQTASVSSGNWANNKNLVEEHIIKEMITLTREMIKDYVKPSKLVYIAFDGPPPRAKMIEQRNRRYKKLYDDIILKEIQEKYGINVEPIWDRTYITPGSEFMRKASQALDIAIRDGGFPHNIEYVLSDTSVPGEGEHKFLKYLDALGASKVCIYSNDGDLLMLVHRFPQHETYILTKPKETFERIRNKYAGERYLYVVIEGVNIGLADYFKRLKECSQLLLKEKSKMEIADKIADQIEGQVADQIGSQVTDQLVEGKMGGRFDEGQMGGRIDEGQIGGGQLDMDRIKKDYIFFSMLGGNDFVRHLYFLRMKEEYAPKVLMGIYQALAPNFGFLINSDLTINQPFLLEYFSMLARQERKWLRLMQDRFNNNKPQKKSNDQEKEARMAPWEKEWDHFQHTYYYKKDHPHYLTFKDEFNRIDYYQESNYLWKTQYYQVFFNVDYKNKNDINQICFQYLKSLFFAFKYYLDELPSWTWYYPHETAPLPSDLAICLSKIKDINQVFKFDKGRPFKPLEQLMLILPHDNKLLPPELIKVMDKYPEFYPNSFKLNVLTGFKYIYSDPDLPKINAKVILSEMKKVILTKHSKELNVLHTEPLFYPIIVKK